MDDDQDVYFFDISNSFRNFGGSRSLLGAGIAYILVGCACLFNAVVGLALGAVKRFSIPVYFHQHWINIAYILTGILVILAEQLRLNFYFFSSLTMILMSLCMAIGIAISDVINITSMALLLKHEDAEERFKYGELKAISSTIPYNNVDLICNLAALGITCYTIYRLHRASRSHFAGHGNTSNRLTIIGVLLTLAGIMNFITHIIEASNEHMYSNYTMDQPFWLLVGIFSGVAVTISGVTGARIVCHVAFLLNLLTYFPTIHYLIFEYRWITHHLLTKTIVISAAHVATTKVGLGLNVVFIALSILSCYLLGVKLANQGAQWFDLNRNYDSFIRKSLIVVPVLQIIIGCALFGIDIVTSIKESLFRVLMASDQRLPFTLIPTGLLTLALIRDSPIAYLLFPFSFALCIAGMSSAVTNVNTFLFLANRLYQMPDVVCDYLFLTPRPCDDVINLSNTNAHFCQALLSFVAGLLSIYLATILGRIMGLHGLVISATSYPVQKQITIRRQIVGIRVLGAAHAAIGLLAILLVAVIAKERVNPLTSDFVILQNYVIFSGYYVSMICIGTVSLVWSSYDVYRFPLRLIAIMMLNTVRIIELFIYLDYRTINGVSFILSVIIFGELVSLAISFASVMLTGHLLYTATNFVPDFDFGETEMNLSPSEEQHAEITYDLEAHMYNTDVGFHPTGVLDMRDD